MDYCSLSFQLAFVVAAAKLCWWMWSDNDEVVDTLDPEYE